MKPKHHRTFIKPTAEELGVSEVLVQDVVGFYYTTARKTLTELKGPKILITGLGTFSAKRKKVIGLMIKHENHLESLNAKGSFARMALKKDVEQRLERARALHQMLNDEAVRLAEFLNKKHGRT